MNRNTILAAVLLALPAALPLAGCQTADDPALAATQPTGMDGIWSSTDGVFVATFASGQFTSRFTKTNEVLAQGSYTVSGSTVNLSWISVATKQQRSAVCTIAAADSVSCNQDGGGSFDLKRSA